MRRVITLTLLVIINFTLQSTLFGFHNISSITPNLLMILTMSFGLMRGRKEGMLIGFFSGFLVDCFFSNILGPYMFIYMIIGYTNGFFHKNYVIEDVLLPLIISIVDDVIYNIYVYILFFLLKGRLDFGHYMMKIIFPEALCTVLFTVIIYKFYVYVNKYLKRKAKGSKGR